MNTELFISKICRPYEIESGKNLSIPKQQIQKITTSIAK